MFCDLGDGVVRDLEAFLAVGVRGGRFVAVPLRLLLVCIRAAPLQFTLGRFSLAYNRNWLAMLGVCGLALLKTALLALIIL